MMKHFPPEIVLKKNDTELYIKLSNGSIWLLGGADQPDSWRGTNPIDVVLDEYSEMKEAIWTEILRPILTENKGTATFVFTPKGTNHAHKLLLYAKQQEKGKLWDWWILGVGDTKAIPEEELEQARKEMPKDLYEQEFLCKFIEGAGQVFKRIRENLWEGTLTILPGKFFTLGADLAKHQDWTVLTPFDLHTFKAGQQERFNQIEWPLQEAKIEAMGLRFNRAKVRLDSTGIGDPVYDHLSRKYSNIEPYQFTEESRKYLLENLMILLENDKIKIPNDEGLLEELQAARWEVSGRGKIRVVWPEGISNDRVMSLALAVWDLPSGKIFHQSVRPKSSEFSQDLDDLRVKSRFHYE